MKLKLVLFFSLLTVLFCISIGGNTFDELAGKAIRFLNKGIKKRSNRYRYMKYTTMSLNDDTIMLQIIVKRKGLKYTKEVYGKEESNGVLNVFDVKDIDYDPRNDPKNADEEEFDDEIRREKVDEEINIDEL